MILSIILKISTTDSVRQPSTKREFANLISLHIFIILFMHSNNYITIIIGFQLFYDKNNIKVQKRQFANVISWWLYAWAATTWGILNKTEQYTQHLLTEFELSSSFLLCPCFLDFFLAFFSFLCFFSLWDFFFFTLASSWISNIAGWDQYNLNHWIHKYGIIK